MIKINKNKDITTAIVTINAIGVFSYRKIISKELTKKDLPKFNVFYDLINIISKSTSYTVISESITSISKISELSLEFSLTNNYGTPLKTIGKGSGGIVRLHIVNGKKYAIKQYRMKKMGETTKKYRAKIELEYSISRKLKHNNIIQSFDFYSDSGAFYLVMDYCHTDLFSVLTNANMNMEVLSNQETECYFKQIILAIDYLQKQEIVHRDIKPENCVIGRNGTLKLIDFGCSKSFKYNYISSGMAGSEPYMAPEMYYPNYDIRLIDIWSAIIVYLVISSNRFPWRRACADDRRFNSFVSNNLEKSKIISECRSNSIKKFILKILDPNAFTRMNIQELTNLKEFKQISCVYVNHKHQF